MKLDKVPPVTVTSLASKSVAASDRVNVIVAVSLALRLVLSLVTAIVGRAVSTVMETVLLASAPSVLALPPSSVNLVLATDTTPLVVELVLGVKVAV